jgi:two-component system response regulator MtrA
MGEDPPLVVCVSPDVRVRERVIHRLDDCGVVLMCADLDELRRMLFPVQQRAPLPVRSGVLTCGDLALDAAEHRVTWRGRPIPLTRLERELLARLVAAPGSVHPYAQLFGAVWGGAYLGDSAILHSAMKRLRRKLRAASPAITIETVRGIGYRLVVA